MDEGTEPKAEEENLRKTFVFSFLFFFQSCLESD